MKFTNKHNAPQTLVNLAHRDDYSRGRAHISCTQLIDAPRIRILKERYQDDIVRDVSDNLWAMVGRALHKIAELGADEIHLSEERLYAEVLGWRLSGSMDVQKLGENNVSIGDYKFTSVWAFMQEKPEWERQLNVYSWLIRMAKGWATDRLEVYALLRDWNRHKAREEPDYPKAPIQSLAVRLWPNWEQDAYVHSRILAHQQAWRDSEWDDELPECSDAERWMATSKWVVWHQDRDRAVRVFDEQAVAQGFVEQHKQRDLLTVHERKADPVRCLDFCEVAKWCTQHQRWLRKTA